MYNNHKLLRKMSSCQSATVTLLLSLSTFLSVTLSLAPRGGMNEHPPGSVSIGAHYFRGIMVSEIWTNTPGDK